MNLFMDNVVTLATHMPIVRDIPNILSSMDVLSMDAKLLQKIAGETEEKVQRRDEILRELAALEAGAQLCRQYARRSHSGISPLFVYVTIKADMLHRCSCGRCGCFHNDQPYPVIGPDRF